MHATTAIAARRAAVASPSRGAVGGATVTPLRRPARPQPDARLEVVEPGHTVFAEGDEATHYVEIVEGTIRCCGLTADGRRQIYRFASEGELLGLSNGEAYAYSAEAVTRVAVRRHRLAALNAEMARDERLRERVIAAFRDELNAVRTQMMLLGRMTAAERIVSFLRDLAQRSASPDGTIHLAMTRGDIADYLGLTLETVSRKINALNRLGAIEMSTASRVRIRSLDRLEEMAAAA